MIREALQYVVGLRAAETQEINGRTYVDKEVTLVDKEVRACEIHMSTLSSLVDYIKGRIDSMAEKMIVQVVSPITVKLISQLNADRNRECLIVINADIPDFSYGRFLDSEEFLINIRSKFVQNKGAEALLRFAGTVESGTVASYSDDGISQAATVKTGLAGKETALVPNPVKLRPYRTFAEVEQPESEFVFRMKNYDGSVGCAIFEADGGAWKNQAMKNIKEYLQYELAGMEQFTVIS